MDLKNTPFLKIPVIRADIRKQVDENGAIYLRSAVELQPHPFRVTDRLCFWAKETPDRPFLGQRDGEGKWQTVTYAEAWQMVRSISQFLLESGVSAERPIAILSGNSIEHGLLALAAMHVGLPYSPLSPAYSLRSDDLSKLRYCMELLTPGLIFVQSGKAFENPLRAMGSDIPVIAVEAPASEHIAFQQVLEKRPAAAVEEAFEKVRSETIAKILFTSGSTGMPKGVINTHGNMTTNWQQITQTFPFMENGGLTLIDWLPWNHTFGGNHNFGLTLYNGGSLYIDNGNPTPSGIQTTVRNLRDIAPTVYFNVPKGFEEIIPRLRADEDLRQYFFSRLKMLFYAGASMPQHVWDGLEELAYRTTGKRVLISTGLGMTEAGPSAMFNTEFGSYSGMLGVPVPGLEVKLVQEEGKLEARFRGKNMTPGYWRNPVATAAAFDEEGYYCTGDALKMVDPDDPNRGMVFDGRIAEDFKLDTGTWARVGLLKAGLIGAGNGLIRDVVITGHDRSFLGAIIFPEPTVCRKLAGLDEDAGLEQIIRAPAVISAVQEMLNRLATTSTGSSTLVKRAVLADFELSIDRGEVTDKGTVNQRAVLANRPEYVEAIYHRELLPNVLAVQNEKHGK